MVDSNLDHWSEVIFVRFIHCKVSLFSDFPCCTLWKEVIMCSSLKEWAVALSLGDVLWSLYLLCQYRHIRNTSHAQLSWVPAWVALYGPVMAATQPLVAAPKCLLEPGTLMMKWPVESICYPEDSFNGIYSVMRNVSSCAPPVVRK